eukprot:COSAG04_NODE_453_length_14110_cov_262.397473_9_plen_124_part_00
MFSNPRNIAKKQPNRMAHPNLDMAAIQKKVLKYIDQGFQMPGVPSSVCHSIGCRGTARAEYERSRAAGGSCRPEPSRMTGMFSNPRNIAKKQPNRMAHPNLDMAAIQKKVLKYIDQGFQMPGV